MVRRETTESPEGEDMKRVLSIAIVLSALFSTSAHAWFFFFLPGSVTGAITDAITGSEGENCVGTNAKVGDLIRLANGDMKNVKSLSGTSVQVRSDSIDRCRGTGKLHGGPDKL